MKLEALVARLEPRLKLKNVLVDISMLVFVEDLEHLHFCYHFLDYQERIVVVTR